MKQNEIMRGLLNMEKQTFNEGKKEILSGALKTIFKTPEWKKLVQCAKKTYPYANSETHEKFKNFVSFVLDKKCLVWFTEDYSFYKKGDMEILGPYEFDPLPYDEPYNDYYEKIKKGIDSIYIIPVEVLTFLDIKE